MTDRERLEDMFRRADIDYRLRKWQAKREITEMLIVDRGRPGLRSLLVFFAFDKNGRLKDIGTGE